MHACMAMWTYDDLPPEVKGIYDMAKERMKNARAITMVNNVLSIPRCQVIFSYLKNFTRRPTIPITKLLDSNPVAFPCIGIGN